MIDYKSYKYALLANSQRMTLYRSKNDFLEIYSEESEKKNTVFMDEFNEIVDYFLNSGCDYIIREELFYAMANDLNWMDKQYETNS